MDNISELKYIIYRYDELVGFWLDGDNPYIYESDEGKSIYEEADDLRNRALEILKEMN